MLLHRRAARTVLIPVIQALSLVLVFALPMFWESRVYTSSQARYQRIVVHPGDTVWSIVARRTTQNEDLGEAVYNVASLNHLEPNGRLHPGQVLLLPKR